MQDWYRRYYAAIERSQAYSEFCRRVFGRDLGQHGFADMEQVQLLADALHVRAADRVFELGCGSGGILAQIVAGTCAQAVGIDYAEHAVAMANSNYGSTHLRFVAADIGSLCFLPGSFDVVISIDSMYFTPVGATVAALAELLSPGGRMGILYAHGADPEHPLATFDRGELPAERTPLGVALCEQGLPFTAQDLTEADRRHALLKKSVLEELELAFIAEGNEFLHQNRYGEAKGVLAAIEAGAHARYLYVATKSES